MEIGDVSRSILFCLLLVMCFNGNNKVNAIRQLVNDDVPMGANVLRLDSAKEKDHMAMHVHGHHSSQMEAMIFFLMEDLTVGKRMPIYFPKRDSSKAPRFLPRKESNSIPFSRESLPNLLQIFSFPRASPQAKAMEDTLRVCEMKPVKGEFRFCATSLESMLDFVNERIGSFNSSFSVVSTTHIIKSTELVQNYTVLKEPEEKTSYPKMVGCHTMPYPYAIFLCHESASKVFEVLLGGDDGDRVEAVAVCHMDTSDWSPNHISFRLLGIEPGTKPVCHFNPDDHLFWFAS